MDMDKIKMHTEAIESEIGTIKEHETKRAEITDK